MRFVLAPFLLIIAVILLAKSSCFYDTKNWTAKVYVLNKTEPRTSSQPASIIFQKMLLADNKTRTAAIIIDSHTPRTVTAKGKQNTLHEYAAVDELLRPFIITFCNDAAPNDVYNLLNSIKERHITAALNFSVTDYHNISLSSTSASVILMNSKIERVYFIHKERIDELQQQGVPFETCTSVQMFLAIEQNMALECHQLPSSTITKDEILVISVGMGGSAFGLEAFISLSHYCKYLC
ncbi:hypothetical protein OROMI_008177 [Orobanche minor]